MLDRSEVAVHSRLLSFNSFLECFSHPRIVDCVPALERTLVLEQLAKPFERRPGKAMSSVGIAAAEDRTSRTDLAHERSFIFCLRKR